MYRPSCKYALTDGSAGWRLLTGHWLSGTAQARGSMSPQTGFNTFSVVRAPRAATDGCACAP